MADHALLSASGSERWLNCPPSARLTENYPDAKSDYAAEGSAAHALCEYKLKAALGFPAADPTEDLSYYNAEMEDCADGYAAYVLELVEETRRCCPDPLVLIEQRLDFSRYVEGGFGTGDCVIVSDGMLHVVDYKHGQGVQVDATDNPQLKLYALGALELFDHIYDISAVTMTIYQPRRENVSVFTVLKESLYRWAEEVLKPTAELAFAGDGAFNCGEWCQFCRAKHDCRERAEANLELARYDFRLPPLLDDDEIADILAKLDRLTSWAAAVEKYALQTALDGKHWPGFKLVQGRSNRKYTDAMKVAAKVAESGYDPYEQTVLGITAMEKRLGKSKFNELLGELVIKPPGKPTLVPESDTRSETTTAQIDFMEDIENV
jgi:hypothetical protein